jgi:uncharacterized protein involved in tolerance to divalent cations
MAHTPNPVRLQLWKDRVAAFKDSGETIAVFCKNLPCSVNSFYAWKKRIEEAQDSVAIQPRQASAFVPLVVRARSEANISIQLPSGVSIQVPCDATSAIKTILERVA